MQNLMAEMCPPAQDLTSFNYNDCGIKNPKYFCQLIRRKLQVWKVLLRLSWVLNSGKFWVDDVSGQVCE